MRIRSGLVALIYKKSLILSNEERKNMPTGDMVNLASVDAMRMQDLCTYGLIAISGPFQITLAFISLYNLLGWSAFVGVAVMILSIPINTVSPLCPHVVAPDAVGLGDRALYQEAPREANEKHGQAHKVIII